MPIQVMPDRKWIHRSRNRKPDSFISAIEPSLERTAVQAVPSLVIIIIVLVVIIEVIQLVVEVLVLVVLVLTQFVGVVLREQRDVLVLVPRPSAKPHHREILRIIPPQNSATGVLLMVVVGRDYSKAFFVSTSNFGAAAPLRSRTHDGQAGHAAVGGA